MFDVKQKTTEKYWFYFNRLDIKLTIQNFPVDDKRENFAQDLFKHRPYFAIDKGEYFLVLTATSKPKYLEGKFGPIECRLCLSYGTYINLNTKILISKKFANSIYVNLEEGRTENHNCFSGEKFLKLQKKLRNYWKFTDKKKKLILIELGMRENKKKWLK